MTTAAERLALANEKVLRWQTKRDHAIAMLGKWEAQLKRLQPKPQPTAAKLPALTNVPGSVKFMPRAAVKTKGDQAAAELAAKQAAVRDMADEAGDSNVTPITNGKAMKKPAKPKPGKKH